MTYIPHFPIISMTYPHVNCWMPKALRLGLDTFQVLYARLPKVLSRLSGRQLVTLASFRGGTFWFTIMWVKECNKPPVITIFIGILFNHS